MRRFGGTNRPQLSRPGNGYGRPQHPGPWIAVERAPELSPELFVHTVDATGVIDLGSVVLAPEL